MVRDCPVAKLVLTSTVHVYITCPHPHTPHTTPTHHTPHTHTLHTHYTHAHTHTYHTCMHTYMHTTHIPHTHTHIHTTHRCIHVHTNVMILLPFPFYPLVKEVIHQTHVHAPLWRKQFAEVCPEKRQGNVTISRRHSHS